MTDDIDIGETEKLYLPWHHNDSGLIAGTPDDPESQDYPHIADLAQEPGIEGSGDKFRADFIVLACNAHHPLFKALEAWAFADADPAAAREKGYYNLAREQRDQVLRQLGSKAVRP
jgi:hypothetical protein